MATITKVQTPDGVTHNIGGGGGGSDTTYDLTLGTLSSNKVPIKLEGSDGTTDTIYIEGAGSATLSVSGSTITITTASGGSVTYTLSGSGTSSVYTITATPSSGTATSTTIPAATTSAAGVMTASDKTKLDSITAGAEPNRTYTTVTGKPTGNQTPAFGGTATVSQISQDSTGQITATDRTIKIPDTVATTTTPGLMSASDKTKLDGVATGATAVSVTQTLHSGTQIGSITVNGTQTKLYAPSGGGGGGLTFDDIYPIGSIYLSVNSTDPGLLFGGTWQRIKDRFLLGAGDIYTAGDTGGSADAVVPYHRHSVSSVTTGGMSGNDPHRHSVGYMTGTRGTGSTNTRVGPYGESVEEGNVTTHTTSVAHTHDVPSHNTNYAGTSGNATGANMPPYLVVYMWQRIPDADYLVDENGNHLIDDNGNIIEVA